MTSDPGLNGVLEPPNPLAAAIGPERCAEKLSAVVGGPPIRAATSEPLGAIEVSACQPDDISQRLGGLGVRESGGWPPGRHL
jgi:hypothetical protein